MTTYDITLNTVNAGAVTIAENGWDWCLLGGNKLLFVYKTASPVQVLVQLVQLNGRTVAPTSYPAYVAIGATGTTYVRLFKVNDTRAVLIQYNNSSNNHQSIVIDVNNDNTFTFGPITTGSLWNGLPTDGANTLSGTMLGDGSLRLIYLSTWNTYCTSRIDITGNVANFTSSTQLANTSYNVNYVHVGIYPIPDTTNYLEYAMSTSGANSYTLRIIDSTGATVKNITGLPTTMPVVPVTSTKFIGIPQGGNYAFTYDNTTSTWSWFGTPSLPYSHERMVLDKNHLLLMGMQNHLTSAGVYGGYMKAWVWRLYDNRSSFYSAASPITIIGNNTLPEGHSPAVYSGSSGPSGRYMRALDANTFLVVNRNYVNSTTQKLTVSYLYQP